MTNSLLLTIGSPSKAM